MLSAKTPDDFSIIQYPVGASFKLDGIRALIVNGKLVSRTFKPIRNRHIVSTLEAILPDGIDGELLSGTTFQDCSSAVMRERGEPEFYYCAFDYVKDDLTKPYMDRMRDLQEWFDENQPC
jgi:DNA ligase-1